MATPPADAQHLPRLWVRTLVWFVFLYALGTLCLRYHGIAFHLTPWSQTIVNGIVKYWYPKTSWEETTVVLFREENLSDLKESYPVSYKGHAEILEALLAYKPRAVFVDFVFVDERNDPDGIKALQDAICSFAQARIPLYLAISPPRTAATDNGIKIAATPPSPRGAGKIRRELDPDGVTHVSGDKYRECADLGKGLIKAELVNAQMESSHGVSGVLDYRLEGDTAHGKKDAPAFAMLPDKLKSSIHKDPMEIIWANGVAPLNRWMGCEPETNSFQTLKNRFDHLFNHILRHDPLSEKLKCPYTPTVSVRHLLHSISDPEVTGALENRAVFYGAGFQAAGDILVSPVYAELPAVYLHAMAHDNLLTFGDHYKRAEHERNFISRLLDYGLLLVIVVILLLPNEFTERLTQFMHFSKGLPLRMAAVWVALAVLLALAWPDSGRLWDAFLWFTVFGVSLLVGAFAVRYLNTASQYQDETQEFREFWQHLAALISLAPLAVFFLVAYILLGLDAAVLLGLGFYFFYKLVFAKDGPFVATAILLVIASLISFWPLDLGPRNIIAYVLFFEVAQHLIKHAREVAEKYRSLHGHARKEWGWWGKSKWRFTLLKLFCELCDREVKNANMADPSVSRGAGRAASRDVKLGVG